MTNTPTPGDAGLERFLTAQNPVYSQVLAELRQGRKTSHWMWFIFPQLKGLGHSPMAQKFGITSLEEAQAYIAHPVLGPRLIECTQLVMQVRDRTIHEILGYPDDMKFRSCLTLFARAAPHIPIFEEALRQFFSGEPDPATLERL